MRRIPHIRAAALLLGLAVVGTSQTTQSIGSGVGSAPAPAGAALPESVDQLRTQAAALRGVTERSRGTESWHQAAIAEVKTLSRLGAARDGLLTARRRTLVSELAGDDRIPSSTRCSLEALSANADIAADQSTSPNEKLERFAEVAWRLALKYPERRQCYETLLRVARDSSDVDAAAIARRMLTSDAPPDIKNQAHLVVSRAKLVGENIHELAKGSVVLPKGSLCLVTWSAKTPPSIALIERLRAILPSSTTIVAICLDPECEESRGVAHDRGPGCELLFNDGGRLTHFADALLIQSVGLVYLTDAQGSILTTSGLNKLMTDQWRGKHGKGPKRDE